MPIFSILLFLLSPLLAAAESGEKETSSQQPQVQDLREGKYQIGKVSFDQQTRRISFPGSVNMTEGILEFAIVHQDGKVHESLLLTTASPLNINIALKLLRYQESPELFPILNEDYESTGKYPEVSAETKAAARLQILVTWSEDGDEKEVSINDLIYHTTTERAMEPAPWLYQGSYMLENTFKAEVSGDLAAIFITRSSLFNFTGKDNTTDEYWIPYPDRVPPVGTPVTITLAPLLEKK
jgi:hypothetical protein